MIDIHCHILPMFDDGASDLAESVAMAQLFGVSTDYLLTGQAAEKDQNTLETMLINRITSADRHASQRKDRPFSRQELAVLFAAMLMEE